MSLPKWLELAREERGVKEVLGSGDNPVVVAYYRDSGFPEIKHDSVAWCAAFVGAMLARAGHKPSGSLLARSYLDWGQKLDKPVPGCVVIFPRGEPWQGHVTFVERVEGDKLICLGGNQSDMVKEATYSTASAIGFRWPLESEALRLGEIPEPPPMLLKKGARGEMVVELQERLNVHAANPPLDVDGDFGKLTHDAVVAFQKANGFLVDGKVFTADTTETWPALLEDPSDLPQLEPVVDLADFKGEAYPLDPADVETVAGYLGCEVAAVNAVLAVEANGAAYSNGRPIILFEPHVFYRELGTGPERDQAVREGLAYPSWGTKPYPRTQAERYQQLKSAMAIDPDAALKSCSWGAPQVMGFNHVACGFDTVQAFVTAMMFSEGAQLYCMARFIVTNGLQRHLRSKHWAGFAYGYNGTGYQKNAYDTKLANAYAKRPASERVTPPPALPAELRKLRGEPETGAKVVGAGIATGLVASVAAHQASVLPDMPWDWLIWGGGGALLLFIVWWIFKK